MQHFDLVIIGGGPAGLTAGIYAARADLKTLLLERGMVGGLAASTEFIENYPGFTEGVGGPELAMQMESQAKRFGLKINYTSVESVERAEKLFTVKTEDGDYTCGALILASGAKPRMLGVKGEHEFHGRGVSYCATCDGAFFRDKTVAVVGGGDAAVEEALFLTKFATQVYIIHRRQELRAAKYVQHKAEDNKKVKFLLSCVVEEIKGQDLVQGIVVKDLKSGEVRDLAVDGVFMYVGHDPSSELVKGLVEVDKQGYIKTAEDMSTSCPGLFAAGDIRQKMLRQVVTAVSDGAIAAVAAEKYLEG